MMIKVREHDINCVSKLIFIESIIQDELCLDNLLSGLNGACPFKEVLEEQRVRLIDDGMVLVMSGKGITSVAGNCGLDERKITGNNLITFRGCGVTLNGTMKLDAVAVRMEHSIDVVPHLDNHITNGGMVYKKDYEKIHHIHLNSVKVINEVAEKGFLMIYLRMDGMVWLSV